MDEILLAVLKAGEVVVDFAKEIYQKIRGDEDDQTDTDEDEKGA